MWVIGCGLLKHDPPTAALPNRDLQASGWRLTDNMDISITVFVCYLLNRYPSITTA
jgi:hypothetical protein